MGVVSQVAGPEPVLNAVKDVEHPRSMQLGQRQGCLLVCLHLGIRYQRYARRVDGNDRVHHEYSTPSMALARHLRQL